MPYIITKLPQHLNQRELEDFYILVRGTSEVDEDSLWTRITRAHVLVQLFEKNKLIGTGAIKNTTEGHLIHVFGDVAPRKEIGWIAVKPPFRGRGFSKIIMEELLYLSDDNVFATVKEGNFPMQKVFCNYGFYSPKVIPSQRGHYNLVLYERE